jgi:hypothetical protein
MADLSNKRNIYRIRRASRFFIRLLQVIMLVVPLADMAVWVFINMMPALMRPGMLPDYAKLPLPPSARVYAFCVSLIPLGLFFFANASLIRLFRLYEKGRIFSADNVQCFRNLSRALIGWCIAGIITTPLTSLALTLHHPPGQRMLTVGLGSPDVTALLIGGILAVITWVIEEGSILQQEQDLTI